MNSTIDMRIVRNNLGFGLVTFMVASFAFFQGAGARAATPAAPVAASRQMIEQAASLKAREDALTAREKENERRKLELDNLESEIDAKLAKLQTLQEEVQKKLDYIESLNVRDKEFRNLIKVYSAMSASKVAPLLDEMTDDNAAKILRAMKAEQVAKIIPKLDKEKAVRVSRLLGMID